MAKTFAYKAKDRTGQAVEGVLTAENELAAANYIRNKGYFVTRIAEKRETVDILAAVRNWQPVKTKDLAVFCRQFATMMDAGLSMIACLHILIEQTYSSRLKQALEVVYRKVQEGRPLSQAMEECPGTFPQLMVSMVRAGETGGVLDTVLSRLAVHFEKEHKINEKIKSAMTYPAVVIIMAMLSVAFILTFVFPTFIQMFDNMKVQLPLPTRILLGISAFLREFWPLIFAGAAAGGYGLALLHKKPEHRRRIDPLLLKLPVFGMLLRKIAIARFSRTLSTLIRGGVPLILALDVVKRTTDNTSLTDALTEAQNSVREGLGLATPLGASAVFTPMVVQMVAVGEETGELDKMLEKVADFYESDVDDIISRLSSLIEPILIGVLGVVIGLIVISIILPLFDIVTNVAR
ncbi:MAG: type II secretion system F family protein [Negativicutes bacterium]|nr:type II secretion system F family protein [Negativicutes bacterium]